MTVLKVQCLIKRKFVARGGSRVDFIHYVFPSGNFNKTELFSDEGSEAEIYRLLWDYVSGIIATEANSDW